MYSQKDPQWADKVLGPSGLRMAEFGCTVTDIAQALTLASHTVNPGQLCDELTNNSGFTPQGLVIWAKVSEAHPEFHFGGTGYSFVQGTWGKFQHWLLEHDGVTYEPYEGTEGTPAGFIPTGVVRTAGIDQVVVSDFPKTATVEFNDVHVREQATTNSAPVPQPTPSQLLQKGDTFEAIGTVEGQSVTEILNGQSVTSTQWIESDLHHFVWKPLTNV